MKFEAVMKRATKEQINDACSTFLTRRNYMDLSDAKQKRCGLTVSAVDLAVNLDSGVNGTVKYGAVNEPHLPEEQFTRLVHFVKDAPEEHLASLKQILYPIFICMHLNLLVSGLRQSAYSLQQKHKTIFARLPEYKSSMDTVTSVVKKCGNNPNLQTLGRTLHQELGETKFSVEFTRRTLDYLTTYLCRRDNSMILEIFNSNISIEVIQERSAEGPIITDLSSVHSMLNPAPEKPIPDDEDNLISLGAKIKQLGTPVPKVHVNNVTSPLGAHNINCGHVTSDLIMVGCDNSSILLYPRKETVCDRILVNKQSSKTSRLTLLPDQRHQQQSINDIEEKPQYFEMKGHSSSIYSIKSFSNSPYIISCSADTNIRLWDTDSLCNTVLYQGHTSTVWSLAACEMSDYFVSCSKDLSAKLWTTERTFPLRSYVGHINSVDTVAIHPNMNYIASGSTDKTIRLWDLQSAACVRIFQGHRAGIYSLAFSPDGKTLASAGEDRRIKIWDLSTREVLLELKGHTDLIKSMVYNECGSLLCTTGLDGNVLIWDLNKSPETTSTPTASYSLESTPVHMSYHQPNVLELVTK